nr:hypothetical protein [Tanacetum cinerariifolium]
MKIFLNTREIEPTQEEQEKKLEELEELEQEMMMTDEYCPRNELQRMEQELWNLTVKGDDIEGYTNCFHKLAMLYPSMVTLEYKKIEAIATKGSVKSNRKETTTTTATNPTNINEIEDRPLPKPMLLPQLREKVILGTDYYETDVICIITVNALLCTESVRE